VPTAPQPNVLAAHPPVVSLCLDSVATCIRSTSSIVLWEHHCSDCVAGREGQTPVQGPPVDPTRKQQLHLCPCQQPRVSATHANRTGESPARSCDPTNSLVSGCLAITRRGSPQPLHQTKPNAQKQVTAEGSKKGRGGIDMCGEAHGADSHSSLLLLVVSCGQQRSKNGGKTDLPSGNSTGAQLKTRVAVRSPKHHLRLCLMARSC